MYAFLADLSGRKQTLFHILRQVLPTRNNREWSSLVQGDDGETFEALGRAPAREAPPV
jgi:hypothetical protein